MTRIALALTWFAAFAIPVSAQPTKQAAWPDPLGYVCYRAEKPIKIDGKLDDPAWAAALERGVCRYRRGRQA